MVQHRRMWLVGKERRPRGGKIVACGTASRDRGQFCASRTTERAVTALAEPLDLN